MEVLRKAFRSNTKNLLYTHIGYESKAQCEGTFLLPDNPFAAGFVTRNVSNVGDYGDGMAQKVAHVAEWRPRVWTDKQDTVWLYLLKDRTNKDMKIRALDKDKNNIVTTIPLSQIRAYQIHSTIHWHDICMKDGRRFSLKLKESRYLDDFLKRLTENLRQRKILEEEPPPEVSRILLESVGRPITEGESLKVVLQHFEHIKVMSESKEKEGLLNRPLPPLPLANEYDSEIYAEVPTFAALFHERNAPNLFISRKMIDDISEGYLQPKRADPIYQLQNAICSGQTDEASYWARILAETKAQVTITSSENPSSFGSHSSEGPSTAGDLNQIKVTTKPDPDQEFSNRQSVNNNASMKDPLSITSAQDIINSQESMCKKGQISVLEGCKEQSPSITMSTDKSFSPIPADPNEYLHSCCEQCATAKSQQPKLDHTHGHVSNQTEHDVVMASKIIYVGGRDLAESPPLLNIPKELISLMPKKKTRPVQSSPVDTDSFVPSSPQPSESDYVRYDPKVPPPVGNQTKPPPPPIKRKPKLTPEQTDALRRPQSVATDPAEQAKTREAS